MAYNPYTQYYLDQAGGGVGGIYSGVSYQRGHGIGSFLGGLMRTIIPLFKKGAKVIGSELLKTTGNFATDVILKKQPWKQSLKSRLGESTDNMNGAFKNQIHSMIGSGYKKRRKRKTIHSTPRSSAVKKKKKRKITVKTKKRATKKKKLTLPRDIFS